MSCCNEITITVENNPQDNINVYIDEKGLGIKPILNFISLLSSNFNINQQVVSTFVSNSADWQETYDEVNLIQNTLSGNWQDSYEHFNSGIIDGGFF